MDLRRANIELHIEELVLHGFAPGDRQAIAAAVQAELSRLLISEGLPSALSGNTSVSSRDAGSFETGTVMAAPELGAQVGRSVYGALGSGGQS